MLKNGIGLGKMFFHGFGLILQLIILLIFFGIVYWVLKSGKIKNENPIEILKKRLAKGEITKNQYSDLIKEIMKK